MKLYYASLLKKAVLLRTMLNLANFSRDLKLFNNK